jgi:gliding motility-associated-like protein
VSPLLSTTYTILSVRDAKCTNTTINSSITINVLQSEPSVRYPTISTAPNTSVQLTARTLGGSSTYSWNPGFGLNNSSLNNPIFNYDRTTEYLITITSPAGCPVVDTLLVRINAQAPPVLKSDLFVPKAWSPNKDGHNDKLYPLTVNIVELKYFRIFNRWGQLMFETNVIGNGWDGIYKTQPQVMEVYTWTVEAIGIDGVYYKRSGNSVLLR